MKRILLTIVLCVFIAASVSVCYAEGAEEQEAPREAIQVIVDDSTDIQASFAAGISYKEWKELYHKIVRDEARFEAKYPNSKYLKVIQDDVNCYLVVDMAWDNYMNGIPSAKYDVVQGMDMTKHWHKRLLEKFNE